MLKITLLSSLVILSACTMSRQSYLADGSVGHSISCGGTLNSWSSCLRKAGELCGTQGYDLLGKDGEVLPFKNGQFSANTLSANGSFNQGVIRNRNIFVKCK